MNPPNFKIASPLLSPQIATLRYEGEICAEGISALLKQMQSAFDYYQYDHIQLHLESPGGSAAGLDYFLRNLDKYQASGKQLHVQSTFMCASAAALLLAFGSWGERRVDRSTILLFHFARVGGNVADLTARSAQGYSRQLQRYDQIMIERLVKYLTFQAGGPAGMLALVAVRLNLLDANWSWVETQIQGAVLSEKGSRRPDWFKKLRCLFKADVDPQKAMASFIKYLCVSFQRDMPMDLREAFALALIDTIDDVMEPTGALVPPTAQPRRVIDPKPADASEGEGEGDDVEKIRRTYGIQAVDSRY